VRVVVLLAALTLGTTALVIFLGSAVLDQIVPAEPGRIVGIALGELGNNTRIPRRALDCTSPDSSPASESCTVAIDGTVLRVDIEYGDAFGQRFRRCDAAFGFTSTACWPIWYAGAGWLRIYALIPTVQPGQPHETRQWLGPGTVRTLQAPHFEVRAEALQAVRQQYPFDNYFESDWEALITRASIVPALVIAALAFRLTIVRPSLREPAVPRLVAPLGSLAAAAICGGTVFAVSWVGLVFAAMRAGLVD
jgi:hypothetical protein